MPFEKKTEIKPHGDKCCAELLLEFEGISADITLLGC